MILMSKIKILTKLENIDKISKFPNLQPFDDNVVDLLSELSKILIKDKAIKNYTDIITFAFFCRKNNLNHLKNKYNDSLKSRLGRGLTFHVTPSNVPINFAYSLLLALLAGNPSIVKISSKEFPQTEIIINSLNQAIKNTNNYSLVPYINFIKYDREEVEITSDLSQLCSIRIIWGGDETISNIRKFPINSRSFDVTFADRYSFAVFNANKILHEQNIFKLCEDFYNDTYLFDQNACTSPHLICWLGKDDEIDKAKNFFWDNLTIYAKEKYELSPIVVVDKYTNACRAAIDLNDVEINQTNLLTRINLNELTFNITDYRSLGGSFLEYSIKNVQDIFPIVNSKFQTLSYFGCDKEDLQKSVLSSGIQGIDRIVPVGKTMDFDLVWDGFDLILTLSRVVDFK